MSKMNRILVLLVITIIPLGTVAAQFGGSRSGSSQAASRGQRGPSTAALPQLALEVAQGFITVDGQAEIRIEPTEIRVVLAVTAEGKTPAECKLLVNKKVVALTSAWKEMGIPAKDIVEDFISVLPRYEFEIEKVRDQEVAMEKRAGYLMQSNLHLAVKDDAQAMSAVGIAFENDVADIIAFDYWSSELDQLKVRARGLAVKAAREKSDVLLGALFDKRPPIINVQETTQVIHPEALYESFVNSSDAEYKTSYSRRDLPQIRMFRPKNTYYRGLYLDADVQSSDLPMKSEISIVSTVRLYFESPAAREIREANKAAP